MYTTASKPASEIIEKILERRMIENRKIASLTPVPDSNSRNLLISIDYPDTLPSGIPATADVTYEYDAAGNRTLISDPLGSNRVDYGYDSLSRLGSETRRFPGLSGT